MNLYKVTGVHRRVECKIGLGKDLYITAVDNTEAIIKFIMVTDNEYHKDIKCVHLCKRDDIIPTVEPRKEFQDEQDNR